MCYYKKNASHQRRQHACLSHRHHRYGRLHHATIIATPITASPGRPLHHHSRLLSDRCQSSLHHPPEPTSLRHTPSLTPRAVLQCRSMPPLPNGWETTPCTSRGRPTVKPVPTPADTTCIARVNPRCTISQCRTRHPSTRRTRSCAPPYARRLHQLASPPPRVGRDDASTTMPSASRAVRPRRGH
jgi:hypothetical protein